MKLYFIGSHSSGKSTLTNYVSKTYSLPKITEVARMVLSEKELQIDVLRHDMDLVDDYQKQIFFRQLAEENKYKNDFVSDRSFDCIAYAAQHSRILPDLLKCKELQEYIEGLKKSDVGIFFVRPSKSTLKNDGIREALDWDGIVAIDAMVKFLLEMFELRYFQINMDNMQERVRFVDSIISILK